MSGKFRNLSKEDRAFAVLDFSERVTRNQLPHLDDDNTDGPLLKEAFQHHQSSTSYLAQQAAALTSAEFKSLLHNADSIRVVPINRESKAAAQLKTFCCDACGRHESHCRYAIDILASPGQSQRYKLLETLGDDFGDFIEGYNKRFKKPNGKGLLTCDAGRFFVGKTCLRKSQLMFQANTMLQEILYTMWHQLNGTSAEQLASSELLFATTEWARQLRWTRQQLELCIADGSRPLPELCLDESMWRLVDKHRELAIDRAAQEMGEASGEASGEDNWDNEDENLPDDAAMCVLKARAQRSLDTYAGSMARGGRAKRESPQESCDEEEEDEEEDEDDDEEDSFLVSDNDAEGQAGHQDNTCDDNLDEDGEEEEEEQVAARRVRQKRSKQLVIESDDEDEKDGDDASRNQNSHASSSSAPPPPPTPLPAPAPAPAPAPTPPASAPLRRSTRARKVPERLEKTAATPAPASTAPPEAAIAAPPAAAIAAPPRLKRPRTAGASAPAGTSTAFVVASSSGDDEENDNHQEDYEQSTRRHPLMLPAPKTPAVSASSIARSMRVPGSDGALGSRKQALLDLMEVQASMIRVGNLTAASQLARAILTIQELMQLVQERQADGCA